MPNISELLNKNKTADFDKLANERSEMIRKNAERQIAEHQRQIAEHRRTHIFKSYEEALDYLVQHPTSYIHWHCDDIKFSQEKQLYKIYTQESYDGYVYNDIVIYKSKKELLDSIEEHKTYMKQNYPDFSEQNYLDEFGYLAYVMLANY